jgi:DNA polymerase
MAKDSEEFAEWLRQNGEELPWARAIGSYRSINAFLKKLQTMQTRTKADGWMPYGLKYAGAHTLRDSGDSGLNVQNLPREPMFAKELAAAGITDEIYAEGVDLRSMITAPEGYMLGVADLSAIEPCVLAVLSEDWELVEKLKTGMDIYEAWARVHEGYTDPRPLKGTDDKLRYMIKTKVLGLGYGAGPDKYIVIAKNLAKLDIPFAKAKEVVDVFRSKPHIPGLWRKLEGGMRQSPMQDFRISLPSGRDLLYRSVRTLSGLSAIIPRTGKMMRLSFWGGALTENLVQACARDVFMDRVLALIDAGLPPILRVHDEAVCLFPLATANADLDRMVKIMSTPPEWMTGLPIAASGHLCRKYTKG